RGKQLLNEEVFFHIERGATEMGNGRRLHQGLAVFCLPEGSFARCPDSVGDHVHRRLEINLFPVARVGAAILHLLEAASMGMQFVGVSALELHTHAGRLQKVKYRRPYSRNWEEIDLETAMDMVADRV